MVEQIIVIITIFHSGKIFIIVILYIFIIITSIIS